MIAFFLRDRDEYKRKYEELKKEKEKLKETHECQKSNIGEKSVSRYPRAIELAKKVIRFTKAWKTFATAEQCLYWKVEQSEYFLFIIASFDVAYTHIDDTTIFTLK